MEAHVKQGSQHECLELLNSLKGILFMGTPHQGSGTASWGAMGADMLRAASLGTSTNSALVKELKEKSKTLQEISKDFPFLGVRVSIHSFIETEGMDYVSGVVGQLRSSHKWNSLPDIIPQIVTNQSARLNWPNERVLPLNGNHSTMCKFSDEDDNDYKTVLTVVKQLVDACK